MIEIKNLTKTFAMADGTRFDALHDVSLTISDGDIYGIIGMSGAGKSTLVRCINMLERPTGGEVVIDGVEMSKLSAVELREMRRHQKEVEMAQRQAAKLQPKHKSLHYIDEDDYDELPTLKTNTQKTKTNLNAQDKPEIKD